MFIQKPIHPSVQQLWLKSQKKKKKVPKRPSTGKWINCGSTSVTIAYYSAIIILKKNY